MARVEIGGRREGQEVWARWIDGRVQVDREFLKIAGLDPGTRFEDPHAFVELIEKILDKGSASVVLGSTSPEASVTASDVSPIAFTAHTASGPGSAFDFEGLRGVHGLMLERLSLPDKRVRAPGAH